jgi:hypothetical protein
MAVAVSQAHSVRISRPGALFTARFDERPSWRPNYDAARDGRFIVVQSGRDPRARDRRLPCCSTGSIA